MKKEFRLLTFAYLFVLLLLVLSGSFEGILQTVIYILAFIIPVFGVVFYLEGKEEYKVRNDLGYLKIEKKNIGTALCLLPVSILIVLIVSYITSLLIYLVFNKDGGGNARGSAFEATVFNAVLPAIFEELAFRYLPLKLLAKRSPRAAVFASAFFFALIHRSFFSIPYAFVAGILFMAIDIFTDSILPSVVIHFANNILALMTLGVYGFVLDIYVAFIILFALGGIGLVLLFTEREKLNEMGKRAFSPGEKYVFSPEPLLFALPALLIAVFELVV